MPFAIGASAYDVVVAPMVDDRKLNADMPLAASSALLAVGSVDVSAAEGVSVALLAPAPPPREDCMNEKDDEDGAGAAATDGSVDSSLPPLTSSPPNMLL